MKSKLKVKMCNEYAVRSNVKIQTFKKSLLLFSKGTPQKDVVIKSDAPETLLLEKHADYIASYGSKKDDYVCMILC